MSATETVRLRASLEALNARLELEDAETVEEIATAVISSLDRHSSLDRDVWGPEPTPGELAQAIAEQRAVEVQLRARALEGALSRIEVARRLGISPAAVSKKLAGRQLVALRQGREWRFPAWQFSPDGVLPGIRRLAGVHIGGVLGLSIWATEPHPDLDGQTPAHALARGHTDPVVLAAEAITAAGW